MKERETLTVGQAKGRPMLMWAGKRPLNQVTAYPAQHVETFDPSGELRRLDNGSLWSDWPDRYPQGGLLFHGDNKDVLAHMLTNGFRGRINLIYIDPPFDSGADYVRKVQLRRAGGTAALDGSAYSVGEQVQYTDIWTNDSYLQFMYERLQLLYELLAEGGSLYLHCDWLKSHHLRCLVEEVFGPDNFRNEIAWCYSDAANSKTHWNTKHDTILFATKGEPWTFRYERVLRGHSPGNLKKYKYEDEQGKYRLFGKNIPGSPIRWHRDVSSDWERDRPELVYRHYLKPGSLPLDWWDIHPVNQAAAEKTDYRTQKPEELLRQIILASTDPGDLVLDTFIGSGTTAAVAQQLGRRWIGCDLNKGAIQTASKRLQSIIRRQLDSTSAEAGHEAEAPAQLSFTVHRVNEYDLSVRHHEALLLIAEHLGLEPIRGEQYFDGRFGPSLAKLVSFMHPLTTEELEEIALELKARPGEQRPVTVICLGMELSAGRWLDEWNRLRNGPGAANRIDVIELNTDPRYGGWLSHTPATARVDMKRLAEDEVLVEVNDYISPTLVERLRVHAEAGKYEVSLTDWRCMVDCIMIDPAFDGNVFQVGLSGVPERKDDWVSGRYILSVQPAQTVVAVKIIDMLGEETILTRTV